MKKINLPQAAKLTSPNPVTLVCTQKPDGSTNLATVSWWTYLSFNPYMIAYAMAKTSLGILLDYAIIAQPKGRAKCAVYVFRQGAA